MHACSQRQRGPPQPPAPTSTLVERGGGKHNLVLRHGKRNSHSWSQFGQDVAIDALLRRRTGGFFVELGGFDGETGSNTLLFELLRGWDGLLIEAVPQSYAALRRKSRGCYMANTCVGSDSTLTFRVAGQISSADELASATHKARVNTELRRHFWRGAGYFGAGAPATPNETVRVRCQPLARLVRSVGRTHVDYLSLDVEGGELAVLQSIFEAGDARGPSAAPITIDAMSVEISSQNRPAREEIAALLQRHGYRRLSPAIGEDALYVHRCAGANETGWHAV